MEITHQADYALRAVLFLARQETGARVSTGKIAEENQIPASFLTKIISQLSIAGLIHTSRGAHGGVWLAKAPEDISVLDVLQAIDGNLFLNHCVGNPEGCALSPTCAMHRFWQETCGLLTRRLGGTSFAQLLNPSSLPFAI